MTESSTNTTETFEQKTCANYPPTDQHEQLNPIQIQKYSAVNIKHAETYVK